MNFDLSHLNSLQTKEDVIAYAEDLGIEVNKKLGIAKLKPLIQMKASQASQPMKTVVDFSALEASTKEQKASTIAPIVGGKTLHIIKGGHVVESINLSGLADWCADKGFQLSSIEPIIGMTWINHNGYSFKLED